MYLLLAILLKNPLSLYRYPSLVSAPLYKDSLELRRIVLKPDKQVARQNTLIGDSLKI